MNFTIHHETVSRVKKLFFVEITERFWMFTKKCIIYKINCQHD